MPQAAEPAPAPRDVTPAKLVKRVQPVVSSSILRKTSGFVVLKFEIADTGRVGNVEIVESTPQGVFDEAAVAAVRKWVYEPRRENGGAVSSLAKARLVFETSN